MRTFSPLSQTFIYDYVVEMDRQGVDVHVLAERRENAEDRPFRNVHLTPVPSKWHPHRISLKLGSLWDARSHARSNYGRQVRRLGAAVALRRLAPDVLHAHFGTEGVEIAPVANALGVPLVVTFYGFDASRLTRDPVWIEQFRELWRRAAHVVVLSESMRDVITGLGCPPDRCTIVHLAKDLSTYSYALRTPPLRRFLSVGRLVEKKGHLDLIDAMADLRSSDPDVTLTIVGEGPLRSAIEEQVRRHGLQDNVRLAGAVSQPTVMDMMRRSDAFVLTSRTASDGDQEGTPTVLIEAQALGLPVVSTRHAGIPEQVPAESHWLLASEGDVAGIAARIRQLRHATAERIAEITGAGRQLVEQEFDLTVQVGRLRTVYQESM